jgi:broad specificity phosphatase PhoE
VYALYITHPQVIIDPDKPVPQWSLSTEGRARAEKFAHASLVLDIRHIVSSIETKATETAEILAAVSGAPIEVLEGFDENDRSATGYVPHEKFMALRDAFFEQPDQSIEGWETAVAAQQRIVAATIAVLRGHDARNPIAFVGHGGVGTLLKCHFGKRPISVAEDQPGSGGGNAFMVRLTDQHLVGDWMPMESFSGYGS